MPLMSPEIQAALRMADVIGEKKGEKGSIQERMEAAGLSLDDVIMNLASIANGTGNEGLKMRANETALKMHGALKETAAPTVAPFTIVINDTNVKQIEVSGGVNPIFLPRQLLSKLEPTN